MDIYRRLVDFARPRPVPVPKFQGPAVLVPKISRTVRPGPVLVPSSSRRSPSLGPLIQMLMYWCWNTWGILERI